MTCIKTGAHIFLRPYSAYAHGDVFKVGDVYLFRLVWFGYTPAREEIHFILTDWDEWFDQYETGQNRPSLLVAVAEKVVTVE